MIDGWLEPRDVRAVGRLFRARGWKLPPIGYGVRIHSEDREGLGKHFGSKYLPKEIIRTTNPTKDSYLRELHNIKTRYYIIWG